MKYLLDTHTILWYLFGDPRLPKSAKDIIESNVCFYSYVSFWEISIKQSKKKLEFTRTVYEIDDMCRRAGFIKLPITLDDFNRIRNLPFQENVRHNDPFDRILIAQAIENDLTIVTADGNIPLYDVKTVW
ncbi:MULTISPECIES: type II toxin-antitoxin system VapC family toxin [unclassified Treponema]|uniref:type II toxin-antitoxin system VapC family toxin n=1 Tax=unclassified Treponema TaxID=2638727 RepID=UPI0020A2BFA0|nr:MULTISPECIES: type II toxin-antitoxin system VapC family toxin [unclassified Treponema]UTC68429.1 type II toxin-antitoxin system VapC family toxin [Treponema sp. OMZ 789]UTC71137.1 type II toxin-antitoxin system VapC family toxin [Treponema sp. OMZ 790]UTC73850.1 type II toxin-antitoxin system VapC family toxin [Treponema sp. OMZ 791]